MKRRFLEVGKRRVHYYRAGEGSPAVLVHSSPGNAQFLKPEIERLSRDYTVFAFDTPGSAAPMLRDSLVWWPWFDRRVTALRRTTADFDAGRLHAWTLEVMGARATYGQFIQAALAHDALRRWRPFARRWCS